MKVFQGIHWLALWAAIYVALMVLVVKNQTDAYGLWNFRGRVWNAEHGLWIATDCQCNTPEVPTCPNLAPLIAQANTVHEIVRVCKAHRASCPLCGPIEIRRPSSKEPATVRKEAA